MKEVQKADYGDGSNRAFWSENYPELTESEIDVLIERMALLHSGDVFLPETRIRINELKRLPVFISATKKIFDIKKING